MEIHIVGVVGAGVMGRGVAQCAAAAGLEVVLVEIDAVARGAALPAIRDELRAARLFSKSSPPVDAEATLARIQVSDDLAALSAAHFVFENVTERWEVKEPVFRALDRACPPDTLLASNTSAIPIARLAAVTKRAPRVLGIHFMNPAPRKPTVELIRAPLTADDTVTRAIALLARLGKQAVVVHDSPGFVSNRLLMLTINEAIFLAAEKVAAPAEIDRIMTDCLGHALGPLATADLIGLDVILDTLHTLAESEHAIKYRPCPLLVEMVAAHKLGRKSGEGFFAYPGKVRA
jgi:3-hydroxybutyryl-CoA dehydrogenase